VIVLGGLTGAWLLRISWLDVALAMPLAVFLIRDCWKVLRDNLPWLVDQIAIAPEAINEQALGLPGVLDCHDIASKGVLGQQVFIDMHRVVDVDDLIATDQITERVKASGIPLRARSLHHSSRASGLCRTGNHLPWNPRLSTEIKKGSS
jgi:divalent metal cation (Fe/Co/Zn/Cd) transporter